jgi:membrane protein required for colicin V production
MIAAETVTALSFNWYDIVVGLALAYGVWGGIRAGLFVEVLRVVGIGLMVAAALHFYIPAGDRLRSWTDLAEEPSKLLAFVAIAVAVYLVTLMIRNFVTGRVKKFTFLAFTDNVGGALAGLIRMAVVMAFVTIMISLTRSQFWHRQVSKNSAFGATVVAQFPEVAAVVKKSFPEKLWITQEIKRRDDPDLETTGSHTNSR